MDLVRWPPAPDIMADSRPYLPNAVGEPERVGGYREPARLPRPPAVGCLDEFLDMLRLAPKADPFTGPDQHALEQMLAGFEPAPPVGAVLTGAS